MLGKSLAYQLKIPKVFDLVSKKEDELDCWLVKKWALKSAGLKAAPLVMM